jgi:hypothetical protein
MIKANRKIYFYQDSCRFLVDIDYNNKRFLIPTERTGGDHSSAHTQIYPPSTSTMIADGELIYFFQAHEKLMALYEPEPIHPSHCWYFIITKG